MGFSERLDECLKRRNISNYKMARDTGLSDSLIGYWRRGKRSPTAEHLATIANYLEISADYLLNGSIPQQESQLRDDERELLEHYQKLDSRGVHKIHTVLYEELDRMERSGN